MIQTNGLTKQYGSLTAVQGLNLTIPAGELFGFLGPNGAGKTTTIRMLTGLLKPTSGTAQVAGFDLASEPLKVKASIGYLAENPFLYDKLTGAEFLRVIADLYRVPEAGRAQRIARLLDLFELGNKANELIGSYSHGMKQKIGLCSVLIHNPRVLFLDEPTTGLDPRSARVVKDVLRSLVERGTTVFMSSHILEIVENMCDRVGIINGGKLVAVGTIEELRQQAPGSSLEDIFLALTGGAEYREVAEYLREDRP
ncbi:MAG: ABC transporter ATP-binding protein [Chloroflexi bacterium]|nr:ABC transporter ATP-binding protein [Chloroflexota bacterium]